MNDYSKRRLEDLVNSMKREWGAENFIRQAFDLGREDMWKEMNAQKEAILKMERERENDQTK